MHKKDLTVRRWWLLGLLAPVLAVAFILMSALPAFAAVITNTTQPLTDDIFVNPCNGEELTFSGHFHDLIAVTLDGSGGAHIVFQDELNGSGVGVQGNQYEVNSTNNEEFNSQVAQTITITDNEEVIAEGPAPNFLFKDDFHLTVNPDGTVTSFHDNFRFVCQG
jgi:hypothetical protein